MRKFLGGLSYKSVPVSVLTLLSVIFLFTGYTTMVYILSCALLVLGAAMLTKDNGKLGKVEKKSLILFAAPLALFVVCISFGAYQISSYSSPFAGVLLGFLSLLGTMGVLVGGYACGRDRRVHGWTVAYFLLLGLAIYVLINFLSTMILYGPWHTLIHAGQQYYVNGVAYDVDREVVNLFGMGIERVSSEHAGSFALVLASSGFVLPFLDWKEHRERGIFLSIVSGIGLLYIIAVPMIGALIVLLVVGLVVLGVRFSRFKNDPPRWLKIASIVLLSLFLIVLAFYMGVVLSNDVSLFSSGVLRKIFNNQRYTGPINDVVSATFYHDDRASFINLLFGMNPFVNRGTTLVYNNSLWSDTAWIEADMKTFEFSAFMEGGLFAFLGFLVFLFATIVMVYRLLHDRKKDDFSMFVLAFLLSYFLYSSLFYDMTPMVLEGDNRTYYSPFNANPLFLASLFLIAYSYRPIYWRKAIRLEVVE